MAYRLVYTHRTVKDIRKLDIVARRRLKKALEKLLWPLAHSTKLIDPKIGEYRFRVGDYQVIFDMIGEEIVILRVL
ncbi:MAG: type II toxin-antitoxin system RelE/ParE family toxin [Actinomycetota bacterium]|nr:type II toxin-antitoxin system RelE/ParE family toxin [Actinomycetota bacterium]